jgi:hypothetical protein
MTEMVMSALPEEFEYIKAKFCKNMCLPQLWPPKTSESELTKLGMIPLPETQYLKNQVM